jgi:hypothetical protein
MAFFIVVSMLGPRGPCPPPLKRSRDFHPSHRSSLQVRIELPRMAVKGG